MTTSEIVGMAGLIVGVAGGLGGPLLTAVFWGGRIAARLTGIEQMLAANKVEETKCRADREAEADKLHDRITENTRQIEYLKGRFNGHGAR